MKLVAGLPPPPSPSWIHPRQSSTSSSCSPTGPSPLSLPTPLTPRLYSNLPTGGFVSSSSLESTHHHSLLLSPTLTTSESLTAFIHTSLSSYASLNIPFLNAIHALVSQFSKVGENTTLQGVRELDERVESMMLGHVGRRASCAQGIALLTLYERAFGTDEDGGKLGFVGALRGSVRAGGMKGHQVIGMGVLCALLGLSIREL